MTRNVLILGATSAIARGVAMAFASLGDNLYLASRDLDELQRIASDLRVRYDISVHTGLFDANKPETHTAFFQQVVGTMGNLDGIALAFGLMGDQISAREFDVAEKIIMSNYTGAVSILGLSANYLEARKAGFIIGITSVAGDRGRQSNYVYGSAKGALSLYLQGLRNRLYPVNVRVLTIKPGFVDTAMTFGLPGMFLVASPATIGKKIVESLNKSADVIYLPFFWRYIMLIIKHIPEFIFKRLKL